MASNRREDFTKILKLQFAVFFFLPNQVRERPRRVQFLNDIKQNVAGFANANSAALLTAGGVVGTVATAVLAGRAGFKAAEIVSEAEIKKMQEVAADPHTRDVDDVSKIEIGLSKTEKLLVVWPQFIPPVIVGTATIASIVMANRVSAQKAAALAAAYGLAERNFGEYKEKVAEKLTGPKQQQVDDEIAQDRVNQTDGYQNIVMVEGEVLCFDEPTARYFRSTMENIKSAVNATNAEILHHDHASAGFFYEELGLPGTSWTDEVGWNTDQLLDIKYSTVMSPDGRPCIAIDFKVLPKADYIPKHY
jgi:hypothetical protein